MSLVHPATKSPKREYDDSFPQEILAEDASRSSFQKLPVVTQTVQNESNQHQTHIPSSQAGEVTTSSHLDAPSTNLPIMTPNGSTQPPSKKPKTSSAAEKEIKLQERLLKEAERAAEKAKKEAEKKEQLEEKARREAEKEAERKKKEAEREEKKKAAEAEKAIKEEKRLRKEQERKQKEEEKRRKERSQPTLSAFFAKPSVRRGSVSDRESTSPGPSGNTPSKDPTTANAQATPSKSRILSEYEKTFPDFFVHHEVKVAPTNRFERDSEALQSLQSAIDSYLEKGRSPDRKRSFDAISLFHMRENPTIRGKPPTPVREIMAEVLGQVNRPIDLTTDSHNNHIKRRTELLQKIPLKYLKFQEDVRPPYHGTYTSRPISSIASLARDFKRRDLPSTDYDYDSEAEWVEDEGDEDAEDCLNSDGEEEEEGDDLEDLDGFLDDENDEGLGPRKMATLGDLEPISTGLCWEDRKEQNTNIQMMPYRMEFLLEGPIKTIDPFSTEYWASTGSNMDPPRLPLHAIKGTSIFHNSPKSVKPFFGNGSQLPPTVAASQATKPVKLITADALDDFKRAVVGSNLTKVGLIEVLKKEFPKQTGAAIKGTLEMVAERVGDKHANKKWALIE